MSEAKPSCTPAEPGLYLQTPSENNNDTRKEPYREAVGSLIFLATVSRPDIAYSVSQVSRFLNNWNSQHWTAVKRIMHYLIQTIDYSIVYRKTNNIQIMGYTDADFAGCKETRKSTSGYIFMMANGAITWTSQKQNIVAQSTTEAEYISLALGTKEALWLKTFMNELGFAQEKILIKVDNQSAIKLAKNPEYHKRTKHIDIRFHFIRDVINRGEVELEFVETKRQLADILTKPLHKNVFKVITDLLYIK